MRILKIWYLLVVPLDGATKKPLLISGGGGPRLAPPVDYGDCPFVCSKFPGKSCPRDVVPRCEATFCTNVYKQGREYGSVADGVEMPPGSSRVTCADATAIRSLFTPWDPSVPPDAKGFVNYGASCYINALLQVLLHTPRFANYFADMRRWIQAVASNHDLLRVIQADKSAWRDLRMFNDFVMLYDEMHDPVPFVNPQNGSQWSQVLSPYALLHQSWGAYKDYGGGQEDSAQALSRFLMELTGSRSTLLQTANAFGLPIPRENSIESLFSVVYSDDTTCTECGTKYEKPGQVQQVLFLSFPQPIQDIYVAGYIRKRAVKDQPSANIASMLEASLVENFATGLVDCDNHPPVPMGSGIVPAKFVRHQSTYLTDPSPPILVLGIMRVAYVKNFADDSARLASIPDGYFDAAPLPIKHWHELKPTSRLRATANQTVVRAAVEFPEELALADLPRSQATGVYKLRGIGIHSGDHAGGHYVAAFYDDATGQWLLGNDGSVTPTTLGAIRTNRYNTISFLVYEIIGHRGPRDDAAAVVAAAGGHPGGVPPLPLTPHTDGGDDDVARGGVGFGAGDSSRPITVVASGGGSKPVSLSLGSSVSDNLFKNPSSLVKKLIRLTDPRLSHLNALSQLLYHTRFTADFMREARRTLPPQPHHTVKKAMDNIDFFIRLYERFVGPKTAKSAFNMSELSPFLLKEGTVRFTKQQGDAVALLDYYNQIANLLEIKYLGILVKPILSCGPTTLGTPALAEFRLLLCVFVDSDRSGDYPIPVVAGSPGTSHQLTGAMILEDSGEYAAVFTLDGHRWIYAKDQDIRESEPGFSIGDYLKDNRKKIQLLIFELPLPLPSPPAK